MTRKILYSPGYGAGWTTWESDPEVKKLMLTYQPIIDAIEKGEWNIHKNSSFGDIDTDHPALKQLVEDCKKMGKEPPYLGGASQLTIMEVNGRVRIEEYDGYESVEEEGEYSGWL